MLATTPISGTVRSGEGTKDEAPKLYHGEQIGMGGPALDIAIDRDAIFKALFPRGDAMQAVSAFPPAIPGYNKKLKNEFDPAKAKALLAKAGFPNGFELDLWALPVQRPTNPNGQLMAQLIQQDWAKIGVKANIKTYEWGEYLKRANNGEHNVYMSGWGGETGDAESLSRSDSRSRLAACFDGARPRVADLDGVVANRVNPDVVVWRRGRRVADG